MASHRVLHNDTYDAIELKLAQANGIVEVARKAALDPSDLKDQTLSWALFTAEELISDARDALTKTVREKPSLVK